MSQSLPKPLSAPLGDRLLDVKDVAFMLGRSPETIRKDLRRRPDAVPPRIRLPGTRLLRWRAIDVETWLAALVEAKKNGA